MPWTETHYTHLLHFHTSLPCLNPYNARGKGRGVAVLTIDKCIEEPLNYNNMQRSLKIENKSICQALFEQCKFQASVTQGIP